MGTAVLDVLTDSRYKYLGQIWARVACAAYLETQVPNDFLRLISQSRGFFFWYNVMPGTIMHPNLRVAN